MLPRRRRLDDAALGQAVADYLTVTHHGAEDVLKHELADVRREAEGHRQQQRIGLDLQVAVITRELARSIDVPEKEIEPVVRSYLAGDDYTRLATRTLAQLAERLRRTPRRSQGVA